MHGSFLKIACVAIVIQMLFGCVTVPQLNDGFRRLDRLWLLENQKSEDEFRYRVIEAPISATYKQARYTLLDLGIPIVSEDFQKGVIIGETNAPTPLSLDEWSEVVKYEEPRVSEHGGWFMTMKGDPKKYILTFKIGLRSVGNYTFALIDYELRMPELERNGIVPAKVVPPMAIQLASMKFWLRLEERLKEQGIKSPRRRNKTERSA